VQLTEDRLCISGQESNHTLQLRVAEVVRWSRERGLAVGTRGALAEVAGVLAIVRIAARQAGRSFELRLAPEGGRVIAHIEPLGRR
jgi:hypothetical protein